MTKKQWTAKAKEAGFSMVWSSEWQEWIVRAGGGVYFTDDAEDAYGTGVLATAALHNNSQHLKD
jgi:hypothetical protein